MNLKQDCKLLAYCICDSGAPVTVKVSGVDGESITGIDSGHLRCYVSGTEKSPILKNAIRDSALVFHRVLDNIFQQCAVIPFRFPTSFSSDTEVIAHLCENSAEYEATLERIRDKVQMEILLSLKPDATRENVSGTEYLRGTQRRQSETEKVSIQAREAGSRWIKAWREKVSKDGMHCFALIDRASTAEFQNGLGTLPVPQNMTVRLSGPWPATRFLKPND